MKEFIITQLNTLPVLNKNKVEEYVDYCLANSIERIPQKTSLHHILPQAKNLPFKKFKNLTVNTWNGVYLLHEAHYIAHYKLTQAINHNSIFKAFIAMHNKDIKLNKINENVLINSEIYSKLRTRASKLMSEFQNKIQDNGLTNAENAAIKMVKTKRNSGYYETVGAKQMHTPEAIQKSQNTRTGMKVSEKSKKARSEKMKGAGNHFYGKHHTAESKQKMSGPRQHSEKMKWTEERKLKSSLSRLGQKFTEEHKQHMKDAYKKRTLRVCPHCGETGKSGNMTLYHFDNCKQISIYNDKHALIHKCFGNFKNICEQLELPYRLFNKSLKEDRKVLDNYETLSKQTKTRYINNGFIKFKNWYAK